MVATLPSGGNYTLGAMPAGCSYNAGARTVTCNLGDLSANARGSRSFLINLGASYTHDQLTVTARISTTTPERSQDLGDNNASARIDVLRPNVYVDATGPSRIVGQGSVFWYVLDYGNLYRRNPALTRTAEQVILRATLPADVSYEGADRAPNRVSGQLLEWNLGTLAPRSNGRITIVVQTKVPAGATLDFSTVISTRTVGDDPSDNRDSVQTIVVQPPSAIPALDGDLRLALRSELDPNSRDSNPRNGVYLSGGTTITWPTGEVLDLTPRITNLDLGNPLPWPYEYRATVIGWSIERVVVNGQQRAPHESDSRNRAGCRSGRASDGAPRLLQGCVYGYVQGANYEQIISGYVPSEAELRDQAHVYWTQPPAPPMRNDVYLYTVAPLRAVQLRLQVEIEVQIVNAYPGAPIDDPSLPPVPIVPLPDPERRLLSQQFDINLLVPRSVLGPGE
jgi:hypothetical protein